MEANLASLLQTASRLLTNILVEWVRREERHRWGIDTDVRLPLVVPFPFFVLFQTINTHSNDSINVKCSWLVVFYTVTPSPDGNKRGILGNRGRQWRVESTVVTNSNL